MILVDWNQIAYACILGHLAATKQAHASIDVVRKMMLNTLRANVKKFKRDYGEVVIAYDAQGYWRTSVFPQYKANRKKNRAKSLFNWPSIYNSLDTLQDELKKNLMYKVLCVEGCEADDIIGYLGNLHAPYEKIMIISGDEDFAQLQVHPNVQQYSPIIKKMIVDKFPKVSLKQKIIRGDFGDGVPNILSPDDVFVTGGRQKPIMEKKIIVWLNTPVEEFCTTGDMLVNFRRNERLIDLSKMPVEIKRQIGTAYETTAHGSRSEFMEYLAAAGLKELIDVVEDF